MAIQTKDDAQGKADKRLDRNLHKQNAFASVFLRS